MAELLVVDVSSYQGTVNWQKVKTAGISGVLAKATEGTSYVNPYYVTQVTQARQAGLHVGHYHFARPDRHGGAEEARHFCKTVGRLGPLDFKPALDFETESNRTTDGKQRWITEFNRVVRDSLGQWPFFYSSNWMTRNLRFPRPVGNGLWLADFSVNDGERHPVSTPPPWRKVHLHQYTDRGRVDGIAGNVDMSWAPSKLPLLAHPVRATLATLKKGV